MSWKSLCVAVVMGLSALATAPAANAAILPVDFGVLSNDAGYDYGDLDISLYDEVQVEGKVNGAASFTVNTFSSVVPSGGNAAANILIGANGGATSVTGSWGSTILNFALVGKSWVADASTLFTTAGTAGAQLLTISWVGASTDQFSLSIAPSAVPLPGAALLLFSGLGGLGALGAMKRRNQKSSVAQA